MIKKNLVVLEVVDMRQLLLSEIQIQFILTNPVKIWNCNKNSSHAPFILQDVWYDYILDKTFAIMEQ